MPGTLKLREVHACLSQLPTLQSSPDEFQRWFATARLAGEQGMTHAAAVQGGGTSVRAAAAAAAGLGAEDSAAPAARIQANPFLKGPAPTFMPRAGTASTGASKTSAGTSKAGAASSAGAERRSRRSAAESGRLQHDDPFSLEPP